MNAAAEKDIRSALRWLRACRGRLAMLGTAKLSGSDTALLGTVRLIASEAEHKLLKLLASAHKARTRKVKP